MRNSFDIFPRVTYNVATRVDCRDSCGKREDEWRGDGILAELGTKAVGVTWATYRDLRGGSISLSKTVGSFKAERPAGVNSSIVPP